MALAPPAFSFVLSLILVCSCYSEVHGDGEGFALVDLSIFKPANVCSEWKGPSRNSFRIVPRYGPCSSSGNAHPNYSQIFAQDLLRVAYLHNRIRIANATNNMSMAPLQTSLDITLPVRYGEAFDNGNYLVTIGIGTPKREQTVAFDTGSSLCWLQCEPCRSCYHQAEPIFNSSASSTYHNIACNDPACTSLPTSGCSNNVCTYRNVYADSSTSSGLLAREKLELSAPGTSPVVLSNFVFGCGKSNRGNFGRTAGLFGLGREFHSLVTQTSVRFGNVFSYCLPSVSNVPGYLVIGRRAAPSPKYTPMLVHANDSGLYFINLVAISVARQLLQVPPSVYQTVGTIIDSATTFTYLPPAAYTALRDAFRRGMTRYQQAPPLMILDTCYTIHDSNVTCPLVILHFYGGVHLPLTRAQTLFRMGEKYCLAFASSQHGRPSVIGNVQQGGMEVIYDIDARRIGFSPGTNCH